MKNQKKELALLMIVSLVCSWSLAAISGRYEGISAYLGFWVGNLFSFAIIIGIITGIRLIFKRKDVFRFFLNSSWIVFILGYIIMFSTL